MLRLNNYHVSIVCCAVAVGLLLACSDTTREGSSDQSAGGSHATALSVRRDRIFSKAGSPIFGLWVLADSTAVITRRDEVCSIDVGARQAYSIASFAAASAEPLCRDGGIVGYMTHNPLSLSRVAVTGEQLWAFPPRSFVEELSAIASGYERALSMPSESEKLFKFKEVNEALSTFTRSHPVVSCCASGDLLGDGRIEHAVGCSGGGGVFALDDRGGVIWHAPSLTVRSIALISPSAGEARLACVTVSGSVVVFSASGERCDEYVGPTAGLFPVASPDGESVWYGAVDGRKLRIFDERLEGTGYNLALSHSAYGDISLVWLDWGGRCVALSYQIDAAVPRHALSIYDASGESVYCEVNASTQQNLASCNVDERGSMSLLVGVGESLWLYER